MTKGAEALTEAQGALNDEGQPTRTSAAADSRNERVGPVSTWRSATRAQELAEWAGFDGAIIGMVRGHHQQPRGGSPRVELLTG